MEKRLILSTIIIVCVLNLLSSQNFNERDSLKSIIKILNGSVFSYRDTGISKEYKFYFNWQIETNGNKAFGKAANVIYDGIKFIKPTHSRSSDTLFFRNKKLVLKGFIQFDYEIEILILTKEKIRFRNEENKMIEYELNKSNTTIPKEIRLWYGEKF